MRALLLTAFLFLAPSIFAQTREVNHLRVRGLDIGTDYRLVVKQLGQPRRWINGGELACYGGPSRVAQYDGLRIRFSLTEGRKLEGIASIVVTSPKWSVSGINVGADLATVRKKFDLSRIPEAGGVVFGGLIVDGFARFHFRRNKLVKISWEENFC